MEMVDRPGLAAASILAAMAILGLVDTLIPLLAERFGLWQFHATRSALVLAALLAGAAALGWRLRPRRWRGVAARSVMIAAAMTVYFACLASFSIAQAVAGLFSAPVWVVLVTALVLRRRVGAVAWAAAAAGFAGVLMSLGFLGGGAEVSAAALLPMAAGLFYGVGQIGTREWCAGEGPMTLLFGFFLVIGVVACAGLALVSLLPEAVRLEAPAQAGFVLRGWQAPDATFAAVVAAQAAGSLVGVGLIVRGYQLAEASFVSVFEYTLLLFASLWAWALFGQGVTAAQGAGIALILASAALAARFGTAQRPAPAA